jgi:hypothetical protein
LPAVATLGFLVGVGGGVPLAMSLGRVSWSRAAREATFLSCFFRFSAASLRCASVSGAGACT